MNQLSAKTQGKGKKEDSSLSQIKSVFAQLAKSLESPSTQTEAEESKSVFNKVVDWCVANWYELSADVAAEKAKLDIYQEVQNLNDM